MWPQAYRPPCTDVHTHAVCLFLWSSPSSCCKQMTLECLGVQSNRECVRLCMDVCVSVSWVPCMFCGLWALCFLFFFCVMWQKELWGNGALCAVLTYVCLCVYSADRPCGIFFFPPKINSNALFLSIFIFILSISPIMPQDLRSFSSSLPCSFSLLSGSHFVYVSLS